MKQDRYTLNLKRQKFILGLVQYGGITLFLLVILIVVYAPLIQTGYYFYEDYYYFGMPRGLNVDFLFKEAIENGRLFEFVLTYIQSIYLDSAESTKAVRFACIISIALFASVIYALLKRCHFRSDHSFLISVLICMLPSTQIIAAYVLINTHIGAALLSSLAALLMVNVVESKERIDSAATIRMVSAVVLLLAALNINQPPAMMYWAIGVILFFTRGTSDFSKKYCWQAVIRYFVVGFVSSVIYYVVFLRILPFIMNVRHHRGKLISIQDIDHQLKWFLTGAIRLSLNLWNLTPSYIFVIIAVLIILTGIILKSLQEVREKNQFSLIDFLKKYLLILCMIALCYLPKLAVTEPSYQIYTLICLASAFTVLFCFGLVISIDFFQFIPKFSAESRTRVTTALLAVLVIAVSLSAHNNLKKFATLHGTELNHMKKTISAYGVSKLLTTKKIYIRRPYWTRPKPIENINMQFNKSLTSYSSGGFILSVVRQALYEVGIKDEMQVTHGAADDPAPKGDNLLIIDMTKIESTLRL